MGSCFRCSLAQLPACTYHPQYPLDMTDCQFVQTIPSATTSFYPVPLPSKRPAWEQFIHGAPRKLRSELAAKAARRAGSCSLSEFGIDEDDEREKKNIRVEIMVDEEEEMRALNEGGGEMAVDKVDYEEEEEDDELYEPEELRHRSKEPTMEIVRHMNQVSSGRQDDYR